MCTSLIDKFCVITKYYSSPARCDARTVCTYKHTCVRYTKKTHERAAKTILFRGVRYKQCTCSWCIIQHGVSSRKRSGKLHTLCLNVLRTIFSTHLYGFQHDSKTRSTFLPQSEYFTPYNVIVRIDTSTSKTVYRRSPLGRVWSFPLCVCTYRYYHQWFIGRGYGHRCAYSLY